MSLVSDAMAELEAGLRTLGEFGVYRDPAPGVSLQPPAIVLGQPQLMWEASCVDPTSMRLVLGVVVDASETAMEQLWDLVPVVAAAVDQTSRGVVVPDAPAVPGVFLSGTTQLPSYQLTIEVPL